MGGGGSVKEMYWVVGYWMGVTFILGYFFYMIMSYLLLLWLFYVFCLCRRKKGGSRDESRHHGKGRTDKINVLSLLSSYLR